MLKSLISYFFILFFLFVKIIFIYPTKLGIDNNFIIFIRNRTITSMSSIFF